MATLETSGSQTAVIGTEHTLATLTTAKTFVVTVDTINMAAGDTVELRVYSTVLVAGTSRVVYYGAYQHAQGSPIKVSVPVVSHTEWHATLKQTAGTGRVFPWNVLSA